MLVPTLSFGVRSGQMSFYMGSSAMHWTHTTLPMRGHEMRGDLLAS